MAALLQQGGATSTSAVAICLPRSFEWVITALASMYLGAAYVPIDLTWPEQRQRFIIDDSGAGTVVASHESLPRVVGDRVGIDPWTTATLASVPLTRAKTDVSSDTLAYILYTSGSTGVPKGVEISHGNLSHLIAWHLDAFSVTEHDRATHLAALGFDAAGWELWPYLAAGAAVTLADDTTRLSPELLQRWMVQESITLGFAPTALAAVLVQMDWPHDSALRYLLTGGDTLHSRPRADLPFTLINNYGPTECTVVSTSGAVEAQGSTAPTIGRAIRGTSVYVLDADGAHAAEGTPGEMYIGGAGVGRGYRNLPELTRQHFLPDRFSDAPDARMYRTGDRAMVLSDGQLAFCGRLDHQEKIRGQRLELDEVAHVLNQHTSVAFAAVTTHLNTAGEKQLVAYVLPATGTSPVSSELQHFMSGWLPGYMIPTHFVRLAAVPLTANGKLDRSALEQPTPDNALALENADEELTPVESQLLAIVHKLLGANDATVKDDFFLIGGHSLLGTQLVLRIRATFGVDLTLRDLFEAATVQALASRVEALLMADLDAMSEEEALRQTGN